MPRTSPRDRTDDVIRFFRRRPDSDIHYRELTVEAFASEIDDQMTDDPELSRDEATDLVASRINTVLSRMARDQVLAGLWRPRAGTYRYNPDLDTSADEPDERPLRDGDIMELVGTLANGNLIVRCTNGDLREFQEVR